MNSYYSPMENKMGLYFPDFNLSKEGIELLIDKKTIDLCINY